MMICKSMKPYPYGEVKEKNKQIAELLLSDYAGEVSEESAIHLYTYQALVLDDSHDELGEVLMKIAKVEMEHLYILGKAIVKLGGNPVYGSIKDDWLIPWTPTVNTYQKDPRKMLLEDIATEEDAIKTYRHHMRLINDEYVKKLLERIIEDEELHVNIFHYFLQKYPC